MERIFLKDKEDFEKHYNKEGWNDLREVVFWRNSFIQGKVEVKIAIPSLAKEAKKALSKIKD